MWPIRSVLFVPAHRRDWVAKALRVAPHAVILDIEDSVPHELKGQAMGYLKSEIAELRAAGTAAFVRLNPLSDVTGAELDAAVTEGLTAVTLPKAASAGEILALHDLLSYHEGKAGLPHGAVSIFPLPETAEGLQDAHLLAKASRRVKGIFGAFSGPVSGDIARAFGFRATDEGLEQIYMNSKLVLDSRSAGAVYPIAGIIGTALDDLVTVERMIRRARDVGYTGVAVLHPTHVAVAHAVYRPTEADVAYYRGMLDAFAEAEKAGIAAVRYHGAMVDYAMLPLAREVVADAARYGSATLTS
jgi:citrate lyase subunit beta/citryl-CoA lyase